MKYLLLMYADEKGGASLPRDQMDAWLLKIRDWSQAMQKAGVLVKSSGLHPTSAAVTVRVRDGKKSVTHGPFAETREQLGGFYVLECKDIDEACDWAAKAPGALYGSVEVRPLWDMDLMAAIEAAREQGYLRK
jgi:hypothetical protein